MKKEEVTKTVRKRYGDIAKQSRSCCTGSPQADKYKEIAYEDVREAFQYYLRHHNAGRPFVLLFRL